MLILRVFKPSPAVAVRHALRRALPYALFLIFSCGDSQTNRHRPLKEWLTIHPAATDVQYPEGRTEGVTHKLKAAYPAADMRKWIELQMAALKWSRVTRDIIDEQSHAHFEDEWSEFEDVSNASSMWRRQWIGQWMDAQGNAMIYMIAYQGDTIEALHESAELKVSATYFTKEKIQGIQAFIRKRRQDTTEHDAPIS